MHLSPGPQALSGIAKPPQNKGKPTSAFPEACSAYSSPNSRASCVTMSAEGGAPASCTCLGNTRHFLSLPSQLRAGSVTVSAEGGTPASSLHSLGNTRLVACVTVSAAGGTPASCTGLGLASQGQASCVTMSAEGGTPASFTCMASDQSRCGSISMHTFHISCPAWLASTPQLFFAALHLSLLIFSCYDLRDKSARISAVEGALAHALSL